MFVLRNIINHEIYTDDVQVDGELMHGLGGWTKKDEIQQQLHDFITEKKGKYYVDDWEIIEIEDKLYYTINHQLNNDSDYKAFYYNSRVYEILNTRTGKLTRHERNE